MADKSVMNSTVKCNTTMFINFLRYSMPASVSIDIYRQTSTESKLAFEVIYMTVASLQFTMSIFFNLLLLGTVLQKKIRITSCGIYLLFFNLASLIGMSIFYLRIIVTLYFNDELEKHNLIHCRLSSMILNCAQILCLWIGAFISVERVLIECFHFSIYRSRICAIISSLLLLLLTIASCITWFLGTQYAIHPIIPTMYLCKMRQLQSTWMLVDEILTIDYYVRDVFEQEINSIELRIISSKFEYLSIKNNWFRLCEYTPRLWQSLNKYSTERFYRTIT
ncbi:unnamed protein product [Adineta steineri]|uniref:Uncharacterized protein n=1 Tax=Adineta steineri TaxID=433720 RepID=A0A814MF36_9BILA|nr:unnamed protein product [Adineta steineri]CAF1235872.1 unnamed protein product [Adineta steineri]CAF3558698.1 unnamed protein product [Adineta steineri]CAF3942049.1 unnamed protein product [Adineta steineri]